MNERRNVGLPEDWDDFFREEAPSLEEGEALLSVCEIVSVPSGTLELRIDLPSGLSLSPDGLRAELHGQSLIVRARREESHRLRH